MELVGEGPEKSERLEMADDFKNLGNSINSDQMLKK